MGLQFSSLQENLKQNLAIAICGIGKNQNLPILANLFFSAKNNLINIMATDLEIGITTTLRGKIEKEGEYSLNGKTILDYVSLLPNQKIDFEQEENLVHLKSEGYNTKMIGENVDEFPLIPKIESQISFSLEIEKLKNLLTKIAFAVLVNESKPELNGVFFNFSDHKLFLAGTDSFRLAEGVMNYKIIENINNEDCKFIIPIKTIQTLLKIISLLDDEQKNEEIKLYYTDKQILFSIGSVELISKTIDGNFPDYTQIIPKNIKTKAFFNKSELIRALKVSAIFSKLNTNDINFNFIQDRNKIKVSSASQLGESDIEINAVIEGDENNIAVNYRYLLDGLQNISEDKIIFEIVNESVPCILKPENNNEYLYLVMPIRH